MLWPKNRDWQSTKLLISLLALLAGDWFAAGLIRCNPETFDERVLDYSVATYKLDKPLEARTLNKVLETSQTGGFEPQERSNSIVFAKRTLYFIDTAASYFRDPSHLAPSSAVWALDMFEQSYELYDMEFASGSAFCDTTMDLETVGDFDQGICYIFRMFQKPYPEHLRFLAFDSVNPRSITSSFDGRYTAWIEVPWIEGLSSMVRLYDNTEMSTIHVPHVDILEHLFSYDTLSFSDLTFCGSALFFRVGLHRSNRPVPVQWYLFKFSIASNKVERISGSNEDVVQLVSSNEAEVAGSASCYDTNTCACHAAWLIYPLDASERVLAGILSASNRTEQNITTADVTSARLEIGNLATISIMQFPGRIKRRFEFSDWGGSIDQTVYDIACTASKLYLVLQGNGGLTYSIKQTPLKETLEFQSVGNATTGRRIVFADSSNVAVSYWEIGEEVNGSAQKQLHLITDSVIDHSSKQCTVMSETESKDVVQVSMFQDTMVWLEKQESGEGFQIKLMDFDKDNDGIFDAFDLFPLKYGYAYDSDGDGYADARDFIHTTNFGNDDVIMYMFWFVFVFIISTCVTAYVVVRRSFVTGNAQLDSGSTGDGGSKLRSKTLVTANAEEMVQSLFRKGGGILRMKAGLFRRRQRSVDSSEGALTSSDLWLEHMDTLHNVVEVFTTILTATSMGLAVFPTYPLEGVTPKTLYICVWSDFYITTIFIIDVITRYNTRDRRDIPGVAAFLRDNWYDVPALLTDIPMTFVQLPDWLGLLKGFRAIRLYRRFTQQTIFVSIMVKRPFVYLTFFVAAFIMTVAVSLKILEQGDNEDYRDLANVLWFSVVTVTTVGYGDMPSPKGAVGRVITVALMMIGIGLVSTLSAFTVANIVTIAKTEEKKKEITEGLKHRWELMRDGLVFIAEPYNPIANLIDSLVEPTAKTKLSELIDQKKKLAMKHRSSTLNIMVGMNTEIELPVDKVMQGAGGKFTVNTISSQAELIRSIQKEHEQSMLLEIVHRNTHQNMSGFLTPLTRINFILRKYYVHTSVENFEEMVQELADIMFEPPRPNGLYLTKVFAMVLTVRDRREEKKALDYIELDYCDPIEKKLSIIDEHFSRYGVSSRNEYPEIISELTKVLVMHERVASMEWAVEFLEYKEHIDAPAPLLQEVQPPLANMPSSAVVLTDPTVDEDVEDD